MPVDQPLGAVSGAASGVVSGLASAAVPALAPGLVPNLPHDLAHDLGLGASVDLALGFAMVLARCAGVVMMLLPGWAETEAPAVVRAAVALGLALLIFPVMQAALPRVSDDGAGLLLILADEILAGATLGFLARVVTLALPVAGQMLSLMIGLASVLQTDAAIGGQQTAIARAFGLAAPVLILGSGLHQLPLRALVGSYGVWPPGGLPADGIAAVVGAVASGFELALRLAAPFLLASVVFHVALGLLGRLVPQVQVFMLAAPGQLLGGMVLLALLGTVILRAWSDGAMAGFGALPGL
jgi:flagellar biosynthetic protein FliR